MSTPLLPLILLALVFAGGLALVPFGLPGLWVIVLGVIGYAWWTGFRVLGLSSIVLVVALAFVGEIVEAWAGFRFARRYGGSRRAGWGAIAGGLVGAIVGVPIPIAGSVVGAFVGAFLGAAALELTRARSVGGAVAAGWGAVLGRAAGAAVKIGLGVVMGVWVGWMVVRG